MKYYIRVTRDRDIYLLSKIPNENLLYQIEKILYKNPESNSYGPNSIYYPDELVEFDNEEDAIAYASLEML
ncbi:MAG: hypothetical protein PHW03_08990 [Eubacteriales bacterium]|nr:hypothetical protein [Eubacteriales bacterium]